MAPLAYPEVNHWNEDIWAGDLTYNNTSYYMSRLATCRGDQEQQTDDVARFDNIGNYMVYGWV